MNSRNEATRSRLTNWLLALTLCSASLVAGCAGVEVEAPVIQSADVLEITSTSADLGLPELPSRPHLIAIQAGETFTSTSRSGALVLAGEEALKFTAYLDVLNEHSRMAEDYIQALRQAEAERNQLVVSAKDFQEAHNLMATSWANSENQRSHEALLCSVKSLGLQAVLAAFGLAGFVR